MSPKACNCEPLEKANDVYAFAMVMYELCNNKCRFLWDKDTTVHLNIKSIYSTMPTEQEHGIPK